jgi:hypothetical protein
VSCKKEKIVNFLKKMEEPKIEDVLKNIYDLYINQDVSRKEESSKYLAKLQDSVSSIALTFL